MTLTKTASVIRVKGNGVAGMERREGSVTSWPSGSTSFSGSSLFSVGEDEIQRNNQEIRKRKGGMLVINHQGHSRCPSMDLKKRGAEWISGHGLPALFRLAS
jgi:hypothetical protein